MRGVITLQAVHQFVPRRSLLQDLLPGEVVDFTLTADREEAINVHYCGIPVAVRIPLGPGGIVLLREEQ